MSGAPSTTKTRYFGTYFLPAAEVVGKPDFFLAARKSIDARKGRKIRLENLSAHALRHRDGAQV
ncbi:hypothetical protein [Rhizorhabdus wittichii]|uniref:hypothetical protein n=1 Tax=Rhizorhabdus wittichii TaxID=160791 RepID=UPI00178C6E84|nr:hypothetical protein [Rhizorhabdus wittichii]